MGPGLYIHVPFCHARCHFCAFYLEIFREEHAPAYLRALLKEIHLHAANNSLGGRRLDSVYLGGGTPTTLSSSQLVLILEQVRTCFGVQPEAEVTLEAHPDTITLSGLSVLVSAGFNRLSFGMQSHSRQELVQIGRFTNEPTPGAAVAKARRAGFSNINLDVMFGLPGQTMDSWVSTLEGTLELRPSHVSCYALTVEEGTAYEKKVRMGVLPAPDAELQNNMEDRAAQFLTAAGFRRYEISNYCRPGYASVHNQHYWRGSDYLGLGPSAQSYVQGYRFGNVENLSMYYRSLDNGQLPCGEKEWLAGPRARREAAVFGLRLMEGIDLSTLEQATDLDWNRAVSRLLTEGYLEEHAGRMRMTSLGRRYADSIAVELL